MRFRPSATSFAALIRVAARIALTIAPLAPLMSLATTACGGASAGTGPARALPAYSGHATELFDDLIEPAAVGMTLDQPASPDSDPVLRERVQVSDGVARVRISSSTSKDEDTGSTYTLTMKTAEVLAGKSPGDEFTISFGKDNRTTGILKNRADDLVSSRKAFVAFVRTFVRPDGDSELHFHLSPDTPEVVKAVHDVNAQQELK